MTDLLKHHIVHFRSLRRLPGLRCLLILLLAVSVMCSACGKNSGPSGSASDARPPAAADGAGAGKDAAGTAEAADRPFDPDETGGEKKGLQVRVLDSYYQYVNDYIWEDLYALMAGIVQTTPDQGEKKPAFTIVRLSEEQDPLLFIGLYDEQTETGRFEVYTMEDGYIYRLLTFEDAVFLSPEEKCFYLKQAGKKYRYEPHVFLEEDAERKDWPEDTVPFPVHDISEIKVTSENLGLFLLDLTAGGDLDE